MIVIAFSPLGRRMKTKYVRIELLKNDIEILQENHYYPFGLGMNGAWIN